MLPCVDVADGESTQLPIKVDAGLWREIDRWLKTDDARSKGYHSKAQLANQALREILERVRARRFEHFNFSDNLIRLIDNKKPRGTPYVELYLRRGVLSCSLCESRVCEHVSACWDDSKIRKKLSEKNVRGPPADASLK